MFFYHDGLTCNGKRYKSYYFSARHMRELTVQVAFLILISISSFLYTIFSSDGLAQEQQVMPGSDTNAFLSLNEIFNNVENSVVQITTSVPPVSILNPSQTENSTALGSGFIYDNKGHVVTNNHVVANAKIVDVTFIDGSRFTANVTGRDFYSDLAVLKIIENFTAGELPPPLGIRKFVGVKCRRSSCCNRKSIWTGRLNDDRHSEPDR